MRIACCQLFKIFLCAILRAIIYVVYPKMIREFVQLGEEVLMESYQNCFFIVNWDDEIHID
jgi:hypothetical protein